MAACFALALVVITAVFVATAGAAAQATIELSQQEAIALATRWIVEGRSAEAEALLRSLEQAFPNDPDVAFLQGQAALQRKDYAAAAALFRRLLTRDPGLLRVRLELARALFLAGDYDAARYHFLLLLGQDLPETTRQNVYSFLQRIDTRTTWLSLTLMLGPDTNPNFATNEENVDIFGLPFVLSPSARAQKSIGLTGIVQTRYTFGPENRNLVRGYLEVRDFSGSYADYGYAQVTAGRSFVPGNDSWIVEAGPLYSSYQDRPLYWGGLVNINHASPITNRLLSSQTVTVKRLAYFDYDDLTSTQLWLSGLLRYALTPASGVSMSLSAARNAARVGEFSYNTLTWGIGYGIELPRYFNADVWLNVGRYGYDDESPLFGLVRRDRLMSLDVTLVARDWAWLGFAPMLTAGFSDNDSTIDLLDYKRQYLSVGVTRSF